MIEKASLNNSLITRSVILEMAERLEIGRWLVRSSLSSEGFSEVVRQWKMLVGFEGACEKRN